jgi:mono/diheme cytochrome c family protein
MPAQIPRSISAITFACAFLGLIISVPINTAFAVDCLSAPDSSAPPNSHWYYRTDRTQQRKCWYLRADSQSSEQGAAQVAREAPPAKSSQTTSAAGPYSLASFKDFLAQQGRAKLSEQEIEKLYAQFLEWSRRPGIRVTRD